MASIFISYRREDTGGYAGRIAQDLRASFGNDQVFLDLNMSPGTTFVAEIERQLAKCAVVVALIGPRWLSASDREGRRRIEQPHDFLHLELAAALRRGVHIVPVLLQGAAVPACEALPEALRGLVAHQAMTIVDTHWEAGIHELAFTLGQIGVQRWTVLDRRLLRRLVALAASLVALALGWVARSTWPSSRPSPAVTPRVVDDATGAIDGLKKLNPEPPLEDASVYVSNGESTSNVPPSREPPKPDNRRVARRLKVALKVTQDREASEPETANGANPAARAKVPVSQVSIDSSDKMPPAEPKPETANGANPPAHATVPVSEESLESSDKMPAVEWSVVGTWCANIAYSWGVQREQLELDLINGRLVGTVSHGGSRYPRIIVDGVFAPDRVAFKTMIEVMLGASEPVPVTLQYRGIRAGVALAFVLDRPGESSIHFVANRSLDGKRCH